MKNKKSFDTSHGKIITNTDEQIDMEYEKPDDGENPDKKTKSKNKNIPIKQIEDSSTSNKKRAISMDIKEIENAWKQNKASDFSEQILKESIEMSKASVKSIVKHANELMMGIDESNQNCLAEPWVQSKVTIIEDYLKAVHDYVMYYEGDEQEVEN